MRMFLYSNRLVYKTLMSLSVYLVNITHPTNHEPKLIVLQISLQPTYGWYGHHGSTTVPIAVGGHNTDSVHHIVGYSDWNTCSTGGDWTETWTDSDGVVDWSPTIILWGLPLHRDGHTVQTILLNSVGGGSRRRGRPVGSRKNCRQFRLKICTGTSETSIFHTLLFLAPRMQNHSYT